eukprot:12393571-Heterocapsa_arctica.AAC.1
MWDWWDIVAMLLLSFTGMLRPGEAMKLTKEDVLLPSAILLSRRTFYLRIKGPKMRRTSARVEH